MDKDYYKILGVEPTDSDDVIKKAYRKLALEHHPDKGGDTDKFKEISEAYSAISDPNKRKEYDFLRNGGGNFGNLNDLFGFGGAPFGFRQQRQDPNRPMRGQDIRYGIEAPINYFIFGGSLSFEIKYEDACPSCKGTGALESDPCASCGGRGQVSQTSSENGVFMMRSTPCAACSGRGFVVKNTCKECKNGSILINKKVNLDIPKGVGDGHIIVKEMEGMAGRNSGPPGNLFIKLGIKLPKEEDLTEEQAQVLKTL